VVWLQTTYKIRPDKTRSNLGIELALTLSSRVFNFLDLVKVLLDASQLCENRMVLGFNPIETH